MSSEKDPRYIYAQDHKAILLLITVIITTEGSERIKTEKKMTTKQSKKYFLHQRCKKTATNTIMISTF